MTLKSGEKKGESGESQAPMEDSPLVKKIKQAFADAPLDEAGEGGKWLEASILCDRIENSNWFTNLIIFLICLVSVLVGVQTDDVEIPGSLGSIIVIFALVIFTLECAIKIIARLSVKRYLAGKSYLCPAATRPVTEFRIFVASFPR